MGLRFRKSIKIAPGVKVNLNKKSVGLTVGKRGAHYTVNSKGKKTASVGIPGTGLSYTTSSGGGNSKKSTKNKSMSISNAETSTPSPNKKRGKGCLTVFVALIVLAGIGAALSGDNNPDKITISGDTETVYDINTPIPVTAEYEPSDAKLDNITCESSGGEFANADGDLSFTASEEGNYKIYVACGDVKSNTLTFAVEDKEAKKQAELEEQKKADEESAEAQAASEAQNQQASENQAINTDDPIVYITNTGGKYHRSTCRFLKDSKIEKHLSEVLGSYDPCGVCNPPQ